MSNLRLWLVTIDESDWDYDRFSDAAVWADSAEQAEAIVRASPRHPDSQDDPIYAGPWIEDQAWKLTVTPAPAEGIVLIHWHAG